MRNSTEYKLSKIIEVRLAGGMPEEFKEHKLIPLQENGISDTVMEDPEDPNRPKQFQIQLPPGQKFEYYINYVGYQRRNDRWVTEEEIVVDEEQVAEEVRKYEDKQREEKEI